MQTLLHELQAAIAADNRSLEEQNVPISLSQVNHPTCLCFSSPIALRLARTWQCPALEIAEQLVTCLKSRFAALAQAEGALFDITLTFDSAAWIYCQPSDRCLAAWLQQIVNRPPQLSSPDQRASLHSNGLITKAKHQDYQTFFLQYTHARCCALIRLARSEGLLHLSEAVATPSVRICWPPIPWLKADQLQLVHPTEHRLMTQLFTFPSALAIHPPIEKIQQTALRFTFTIPWPLPERQLWRQTKTLSDAFHHLHRDCQIWGSQTELGLAQARLGLVLATQSVLRLLLEDLLGIHAPLEL